MTIDPEKPIDAEQLAEALEYYSNGRSQNGRHLDLIFAAARAHLATLPRYKEVEVNRWIVMLADGCSIGVYETLETAQEWSANYPRSQIVRLTGTAKIKVPQ